MILERLVPRILTALVVAASAFGLLSIPIGDYDDSLLLMGARLSSGGSVPYLDFYTHYGPFGFTLLSALTRGFGSPEVALRIGEIALLAAIAVATHLLYRSLQAGSRFGEYAVALVVAAFSQAAMQPAFLGFAFAMISLLLFVLSRTASRPAAAMLDGAAGGVSLALAALTRPVFAAYVAAAVVILEAAAGRPNFGARRAPLAALSSFFGSAVLAGGATWVLLYPRISPAVALDATILAPSRLIGVGDARYLVPGLLSFEDGLLIGLSWAVAAGAALFAVTVTWAAVQLPAGARLALACAGVGGALPVLLAVSDHPGRDASIVALALLLLAAVVVFGSGGRLAESPLLRSSAAFGLAAAAFGHYYWARADASHLVLLMTLAFAGAGLLLPRLRPRGRAAVLGLLLFAQLSG
ncbi:MAG TPA: hypothetical protein VKG01_12790, partial [Thermoanaerobaculia bacterium]|nr:hypothetical protein [Thermoanaerobaculia bacterium]